MANPFYVEPANPLKALMIGEDAFASARQGAQQNSILQGRQDAAQLASQGDTRGALARLMGVGDIQGATLLNQMQQQSPENIAATERAKLQVQNEFAPKTLNVKQPGSFGEEVTVERAPDGSLRVPNVQGLPSPGTAGASSNLTGTEFLNTLDKPKADQVKALAEGRMQFPSGFALKSPYWQQMISAVSQYDPSFDAVNFNSRAKTRNDFTSGKSAQNITALNTVIGHLDTLQQKADALNNFSFTPLNTIVNEGQSLLGDPRQKDFNVARNAVSDELARVFRQAGMSDHEINQWKENISSSNSPDQFKGVIATGLHLLDSRLQALGQQYNQGMGTTKNPIELLSPKSQQTLAKLAKYSGEGGMQAPAQVGAPGATQPQQSGGDPLSAAKDAIARGAPRDKVIQRLQQNGIDPSGL